MNTFVFQPNMTWRRAGYALLSDSLSYRDVINANPGWDVTIEPAPGGKLNIPSSTTSPGLSQRNLTPDVVVSGARRTDDSYYPYSSREDYINALVRYTPEAIADIDQYNGWNYSSYAVSTGKQEG